MMVLKGELYWCIWFVSILQCLMKMEEVVGFVSALVLMK
jgi:hypothetical protein